MDFRRNADVFTSDGKKVGKIHRVVLDPRSKIVTDLVVKEGHLFTRDKVVSIDRVESGTELRATLKKGAEKPEDLPDFEEKHYFQVDKEETPRDREQARPIMWYFPLPRVAWWRTSPYPLYPRPPFVAATERNIPEGTVPLEEGAKVVSLDGEHVGDVERVYTEPEEQRITHLLLSQGVFSKEEKLIPTAWLDGIFENVVRLVVDAELIEGLPPYSPSDE
jgi:sporulation protein YlmC with PRC-barrel domain